MLLIRIGVLSFYQYSAFFLTSVTVKASVAQRTGKVNTEKKMRRTFSACPPQIFY